MANLTQDNNQDEIDTIITRNTINGVIGPKYKLIRGRFQLSPGDPLAEESLTYQARPDDLFIVTYPKNGTTWTQNIVSCIIHGGKIPDGQKLYDVCPFLEMMGKYAVENLSRPAAIKTHLVYQLQPKQEQAKYILVIRNPLDACVSFYHHHRLFKIYDVANMSFDEFFPFYLNGNLECGSYFDWYLSWWNQKDNLADRLLILTYEDMKADIKNSVLKIASFMGQDYLDKVTANDNEILDQVIDNSCFETMKDKFRESQFAGDGAVCNQDEDPNSFIRKGIVGDYKNYMNQDEIDQTRNKFHEKFDGTGLELLWDTYHIFD